MKPRRRIICTDALPWLNENKGLGAIFTSLPDYEAADYGSWRGSHECNPVEYYEQWFIDAAHACMQATAPGCPTIFYQTDRKHDRELISKTALLSYAAYLYADDRRPLLWHKIIERKNVDRYRPGIIHMMAFGDAKKKCGPGVATADIFKRGDAYEKDSFSYQAIRVALNFCSRKTDTIIDPFCGTGSMLAIANEEYGMNAIGIDIDSDKCVIAQSLTGVGKPKKKRKLTAKQFENKLLDGFLGAALACVS